MRVVVTGTPGTGKTSAVTALDADLEVVHLNEVLEDEGLYTTVDEDRDSLVADLEALRDWAAGLDDCLFESHLAHHLPADRVVVLRCRPDVLRERLRERGVDGDSIDENAESEALDVVLSGAVERHGRESVYEIDTTDLTVEAVASAIGDVVAGDREPAVGTVDFIEYR